MRELGRQGRVLLLATAVAVGLVGCGGGSFTDSRDGKKYKTVKIGYQTWMAKNLNYQTESGSWCYEDKADNCKKYGRLYNWNTANVVCPKGWHLPSRDEWTELVTAVGGRTTGGDKLKSKIGWNVCIGGKNGTDDFGFSALSGGGRSSDRFHDAGCNGEWWTSTEYIRDGTAYCLFMGMIFGNVSGVSESANLKSYGISVRCVADT